MKFSKLTLACLALGSGLLLSACGGGDSAPTRVATTNAVSTINATTGTATIAAVTGQTFTFAAPVTLTSATGTSLAVNSVSFGGTTAKPTFNLATTEGPITGDLTFGSCIFTVVAPVNRAGQRFTVDPCAVTFATSGLQANGNSSTANVTLTLGSTESRPVPLTLSISPQGTITIGNVTVAVSVPVADGTGS